MTLTLRCCRLGILGLTEQYIHDKLTRSEYQKQMLYYKEQVALQVQNSGADGNTQLDADLGLSMPQTEELKVAKNASDRSIHCEEREFRLVLFRHWSLWEAMYYSSYVATKLGIWKEKGRQRLTQLLAQMGFPNREYTQPYMSMSVTFKRDLREKLGSKGPLYGLHDLCFPSFQRQYGFKCAVSASDSVYAMTALLDGGLGWLKKVGTKEAASTLISASIGASAARNGGQGGHQADAAVGVGGSLVHSNETGVGTGMRTGVAGYSVQKSSYGDWADASNDKENVVSDDEDGKEEDRDRWKANFYVAVDALARYLTHTHISWYESCRTTVDILTSPLSSNRVDLLQHGIHLAMHFQSAVVRIGTSILDNKIIKTLKNYQLAVMGGRHGGFGIGSGGDHHFGVGSGTGGMVSSEEYKLFSSSVPHLLKLGLFLVEALKEFRRSRLPLVIAALNEATENYLVVGISKYMGNGRGKRKYVSDILQFYNYSFTRQFQSTDKTCAPAPQCIWPSVLSNSRENRGPSETRSL